MTTINRNDTGLDAPMDRAPNVNRRRSKRASTPLLATVDSSRPLRVRERDEHEFYREPEWAVLGLLDVQRFTSPVWDPACGRGTVCRVFGQNNVTAFGTDLIDRGNGESHWWRGTHDFLSGGAASGVPLTYQSIVCNPPFDLAADFLRIALRLATHKVAFLLRLAWLEGIGRRWVFDETPLAAIHPFAARVSMPPGDIDIPAKGGAVAFMWAVWDLGWPKGMPPIVRRIERGPA